MATANERAAAVHPAAARRDARAAPAPGRAAASSAGARGAPVAVVRGASSSTGARGAPVAGRSAATAGGSRAAGAAAGLGQVPAGGSGSLPPDGGARGWLGSVRPFITAHVEDDSLVERRYHELIAAALRLFERRGFDRTTIEEIAAELGLSVGAIYRYVERKEDILLLTLAHTLWQFQTEVAAATLGVDDPAERLGRAIDVYYRTIARDTRSTLLAYRESYVLEGERRQLVKDLERETNRIFEAIIAEGAAGGVFRPADAGLTAYTIVMLGHMWALKRWHLARALTLDEYIDQQRRFILDGLAPAAPRPVPAAPPARRPRPAGPAPPARSAAPTGGRRRVAPARGKRRAAPARGKRRVAPARDARPVVPVRARVGRSPTPARTARGRDADQRDAQRPERAASSARRGAP